MIVLIKWSTVRFVLEYSLSERNRNVVDDGKLMTSLSPGVYSYLRLKRPFPEFRLPCNI